ncbi:hypothetical protein EZV62_006066 [Acer yangbiense]|uniref:Uncharacterized protein n=1 Tax=Acer yangbiense TaxID=1000413 RepID=A0A5C7IPD5_9ROSI|nr:hypothetical protein EZV62_006066 [Acer yangbiense]
MKEIEQCTTFKKLLENLHRQVHKYHRHLLRENKGVDVENLLNKLLRHLRRKIKSELCLDMLKKPRIWAYDSTTPASGNATIYSLLMEEALIKAWNVDANKRVVCDLNTTEPFPSVLDLKCVALLKFEPIFVSAAASRGFGSSYTDMEICFVNCLEHENMESYDIFQPTYESWRRGGGRGTILELEELMNSCSD